MLPCITVALFMVVVCPGTHKLIHTGMLLAKGIVQDLNLACDHPSSVTWAPDRESTSATNVAVYCGIILW
jgi:hypothetical protein